MYPNGCHYGIGREDGTAELLDTSRGKVADLGRSRSYMTREMAWSPNGRCIASADLSGRFSVATFQPKTDASAQQVIESTVEIPISAACGTTLQLLFHSDSVNQATRVHDIDLESCHNCDKERGRVDRSEPSESIILCIQRS